MKTSRTYTMRARAEATARTRDRILDAVVALAEEKISLEIVLADVAARAGVSVQTVLRHFGSKDALFVAARERAVTDVTEERWAPPGDVEAAVATIAAHYERRGEFVLRALAQAQFDATAADFTALGKAEHRQWVADTFAPQIAAHPMPADALVDLLLVATDVYTWALLRRDAGHDPQTTVHRMLQLVRAVLHRPTE